MSPLKILLPISKRPAVLLENYFNKYHDDPVLHKLYEANKILMRKTNFSYENPVFNKAYYCGGGGRIEELQKDLLKEQMPKQTYQTILLTSVDELVRLVEEEKILTSKELN